MSEEMNKNLENGNNNENNGNNPAPAENKPEPAAAPKKSFKEVASGIWNSKPAKAIRTGVKYVAIGGGAVLALIGAAGVVKAFKDDDRTSEIPASDSDEQQTDDQTDVENPDVPEVPDEIE